MNPPFNEAYSADPLGSNQRRTEQKKTNGRTYNLVLLVTESKCR